MYILEFEIRAQSFTSLMADLRQDINRVSSFSRLYISTLIQNAPTLKILKWALLRKIFGLMYQCLNGAIPSRTCTIKTPAKCKTIVYVL